MPLPPLPDNNTPRFKFNYTCGSFDHTLMIRSGISPAVAGTLFTSLVDAASPLLFASTLNFVEWSASGSPVFNLVTTGAEGHTWGSGGALPYQVSWYLNFVGRSAGGYRTRYALFSANSLGANNRFSPTESAPADAAVAVLNVGGPNLWAKDGNPVVWKSYVNAGANAHWQKEVR